MREGFAEKWGTLADAAGVRRGKDARKAFILVSAHLLRIPVASHALQDGVLTAGLERTPQTDLADFQNKQRFCCSLPRSSVLFSTPASLETG